MSIRTTWALIALVLVANSDVVADWPQFQQNAASQGRAEQAVEPPFQLRWVWYGDDNVRRSTKPGEVPRLKNDRVGLLSFTMHAVVAQRRVVFGDLEGKLHCLDARDGSTIWRREFPGAFIAPAAIETCSGIVVAPCQDGSIYGVSLADGARRWDLPTMRPCVTPAKLQGGTAFVGSLDGKLYAIDVASGKPLWTYDARAALRQPPAIAQGQVFFGSEDMIFHAVDQRSGEKLWRSKPGQFTGQSFRNTWPVIVGDKVTTFQVPVEGMAEYVMEALLFNATPGDHEHKQLKDWPKEREAIVKWLEGDMTYALECQKFWQEHPGRMHEGSRSVHWAGGPLRKTFYVLDAAGDGRGGAKEPYQVPMGIVGGTGNANMGPVLDAHGRAITWWRVSARSIIPGGSFGTAFSPDLSGLDLATGDRIILPTERDIHRGGPSMELDNHHMLTAAGDYLYYHNPFRQARWVKLDGKQNPSGTISVVYGQHDGGGFTGDVVYYKTKDAGGARAKRVFDSHGAARTPVVIADEALFVNEIDIRALACYETQSRAPGFSAPEAVKEPRAPSAVQENPELKREAADHAPDDVRDYVWQKRTISDIDASADDLRAILVEQVQLMLDTGPLRPYFAKRGELEGRWYFTNPGDTVAALARTYPYLREKMQGELRTYLARHMREHPPCSDAIVSPTSAGKSRNDFAIPEHLHAWGDGRLYRQFPRAHNVYSLWLYVDATGDPAYAKDHWDEIRKFAESHSKDDTTYLGGASGPIGLARLAHLVGHDVAEAEKQAIVALEAAKHEPALRAAMAKRWGFGEWHDEFNFAGFHLLHLSPEVARYVRHQADTKAKLREHIASATLHWPMWSLSQASTFTRYYGESHALSPEFSAMIFPTKALVEQSSALQLRRWVAAEDAPRGDLFFLERLVLAIEAHGYETWVDVRQPRQARER